MYGNYGSGGNPPPNRQYNYGPPNDFPTQAHTRSPTREAVARQRAEAAEVKEIVDSLRVEELKRVSTVLYWAIHDDFLQQFLQLAGQDYRGKKGELQMKIKDMVKGSKMLDPTLFTALKQLHRQRSSDLRPDYASNDPWYPTAEAPSYRRPPSNATSAMSTASSASSRAPTYHASSTSSNYHRSMPGISSLFSAPSAMTDPHGNALGHITAAGLPTKHLPSASYDPVSYYNSVKPSVTRPNLPETLNDVKFSVLPFYEPLTTIFQPATLRPKPDVRHGYQELSKEFQLSVNQANEITTSRKIIPSGIPMTGPKVDFGTQLLIRFAMSHNLPTGAPQLMEDCIPPNLGLKVNGKSIAVPTLPVDKKNPNVQFKMTRPVDITGSCKLSPVVPNVIHLTWSHPMLTVGTAGPLDYTKTFCVCLFLVTKLSSEDLARKVTSKGMKSREYTTALIRDKLAADADDEIATTSLRAQLMCPLGKMRIRTPGRSTICTHIQCFDILLFLQMNERKPTWSCPICDKKIPFETLVVDGFFTEILSSSKSGRATEVAFLEKSQVGHATTMIDWEPVLKDEKQVIKQEPSAKRLQQSPINLSSPSTSKKRKDEPEIIDLSSDDDDDDRVTKKKSSSVNRRVSSSSGSSSADDTEIEGSDTNEDFQRLLLCLSASDRNDEGSDSDVVTLD